MSTQVAEKTTYAIDPAHTTVEFAVRHLMITKVRGRFAGVAGRVELEPGSDVPVAVSASLDASTIDTREPQRDTHLKSADFFEVEKHAALDFVSTRIEGKADAFTIHGHLTIHGVTREVALKAAFEGRAGRSMGRSPRRLHRVDGHQSHRFRLDLERRAGNRRRHGWR